MDWQDILNSMAVPGTLPGAAMTGFGSGHHKHRAAGITPESLISQIPGQVKPYLDPYAQTGQRALPGLEEQFNQLISDPGAFYKKWGEGYTESPGYQRKLKAGTEAAFNAAAAGGMAGSPMAQEQSAQIAEDIAGEDFNNYISQMLGMYGLGLGGKSDLSRMGLTAGTEYANTLGGAFGSMAQMAWQREAQKALAKAQKSHDMWGTFGTAAGAALPWIAKGIGALI